MLKREGRFCIMILKNKCAEKPYFVHDRYTSVDKGNFSTVTDAVKYIDKLESNCKKLKRVI